MAERSGGCLCGAVRYTLKSEVRAIAICHCTHCRRLSGSAFLLNVVIPAADYEQSGETHVYVDSGDSGQPVHRHFCGRCGAPIYAVTALSPGRVVVKAGTRDDLTGLPPKLEIYTDHAVTWLPPVAGTRRFARNV